MSLGSLILIAAAISTLILYVKQSQKHTLKPKDARKMIMSGVTLIDVRPPEEFSKGHITGAINIPYTEIKAIRRKLDKKKKIVVYAGKEKDTERATRLIMNIYETRALNGGTFKALQRGF